MSQHPGSTVQIPRPDGQTAPGYLASAGKSAPGVVVIEEWWGLNDQIKGVCDRLQKEGFTALAPDFFRGRVTTKPDEASHLMQTLDFQDATTQDVRGAVRFLKEQGAPKVGIVGFCMGGAVALLSMAHVPELDTGVVYYGIPPQTGDLAKIHKPLQLHFAEHDDWCNPQAIAELEKVFHKGKVPYELHRYDARHGFSNEVSPIHHYKREAAELAWGRTVPFLKQHLA